MTTPMAQNKYYIHTDIGRIYYSELPEDTKLVTDRKSLTPTEIGFCYVDYYGKLLRLYNTSNDLQVVRIYERNKQEE